MEAVSIHDMRSLEKGRALDVHLIDILRLRESEVIESTWRIENIECLGILSSELEQLCESGEGVGGAELMRLAAGVYQIIWGDFRAFKPSEKRPWLVVRAVDSSFYVVITSDEKMLQKLRLRYIDVRPSLGDEERYA
jgi:hypothetical protein